MARKPMRLGAIQAASQNREEPAPKPAPAPAREVVRAADTGAVMPPPLRIGVSIDPAALATARCAFLSDKYQLADPPPSMTKWVGRAVEEHLRRSPASRRRRAEGLEEVRTGPKVSYNVPMPPRLADELREGVRQEVMAGRSISVSALVREAIAVAVEEARDRAGGALPKVTGPLPHGR